MISIPEFESRKYIFECLDENDDPAIPEKCIYSLFDVTNEEYIIEETEFVPSTSTITLNITVEQNTIQESSNKSETRLLIFKCLYNNQTEGSARSEYYRIVK